MNFRAEFGRAPRNLDRMEAWVQRLSREGAEFICFPEMSVCGYERTEAVKAVAEPVPGPSTARLVDIAARFGVVLLAGLAEADGQGRQYISQVIAAPEGLLGVYRKTHLNQPEKAVFWAGDDIGVFAHPRLTFGVQLCYDAHFPELSTLQALSGAEVLFVASASPRDNPQAKRSRMLRYLPARAYDNGCYVAACNLVGKGARGQYFGGVALLINPKGELLAEVVGEEEGAAVSLLPGRELNRLRQTKMGYFLAHRRPDLYGPLCRREQDSG
ncbi:MAG: nitrilase [Chloroflexi bacterium]|nr:MAG: nitrilase [Chloroflexota bacterium]